MSFEARHRDIAALLARGVIRVNRSPLSGKVIESHMPDSNQHADQQPAQGKSAQADDQSQGYGNLVAPNQHGVINEAQRFTRNRRASGQDGYRLLTATMYASRSCSLWPNFTPSAPALLDARSVHPVRGVHLPYRRNGQTARLRCP